MKIFVKTSTGCIFRQTVTAWSESRKWYSDDEVIDPIAGRRPEQLAGDIYIILFACEIHKKFILSEEIYYKKRFFRVQLLSPSGNFIHMNLTSQEHVENIIWYDGIAELL